jgi:hypothetical protein
VAAPARVSVWAAVSLAAGAPVAAAAEGRAGPEAVVARAAPAESVVQLIPETCGVPRGRAEAAVVCQE